MTETSGSWSGLRLLVVSPTPTHPQDHGNRKRIFEICRELKSRGASVHFAHYASEHDWRHARPVHHERQMREAWDGYDTIAPSCYLHMPSIGRDHLIDEWADPALSAYVAWACHVHRFDAVIVNYTWLSFCFDSVPASVFKILDTNDAFGRRRAMLAKMEVEPEFFHTTEEEEAKGLARADLVWAIKDEEREYFIRDLGAPNCLTMLHAETLHPVWKGAVAEDGFLRAGVIGARNNVNRRNLENFLAVALPLFNSYLSDVKIVIAGSCTDDFTHLDHPNIELLGRVAHVDSFYRDIDVVVAPIQTSTGLKIKVSEALAAGAPLVALAHATEGYPTQEPHHLLPDFKALAMALIELAFDRAKITNLAQASHRVSTLIQNKVLQTLDQTRQQIIARERGHICVVAPAVALDPASLLHDHLTALLGFITRTHPVALYLTGVPAGGVAANPCGVECRVFAEPALIAALGDRAPESWSAIELGDLFECRGFERAYFLTDADGGLHGTGGLTRAYVRHDAVTLAGGNADALVEYLRSTVPVVLLSADPASINLWADAYGIADLVAAPWRQTDPFVSLTGNSDVPPILLLASPEDRLLPAIQAYGAQIGAAISLLDPNDPQLRASLVDAGTIQTTDPRRLIAGAKMIIDLASPHPLVAVLREAARRIGIPVVTPVRGIRGALRGQAAPDVNPTSLLRLLQTIAMLLADGNFAAQQSELTQWLVMAEAADAGWFWLWRDLMATPNPDAALAELLGT